MATRDYLKRRKWRVMAVLLFVMTSVAGAAIIAGGPVPRVQLPPSLFWIAILIWFLSISWMIQYGYRCPHCRGNLFALLEGSTFTRDIGFQFCPHCGIPMDEPLPADTLEPTPSPTDESQR